jgi:hypothetical protein
MGFPVRRTPVPAPSPNANQLGTPSSGNIREHASATARSAAPRRRFWAEADRETADMETRSCGEEDDIKTFGGAARTVSLNGACRAAGGDLWSSSGLHPGGLRAKKLLSVLESTRADGSFQHPSHSRSLAIGNLEIALETLIAAFAPHCLRHRRHGWRERPEAKRLKLRPCRR